MSILNSYLVTSQLLRPFDPLIHEKYVINTRIIVPPTPPNCAGDLYFCGAIVLATVRTRSRVQSVEVWQSCCLFSICFLSLLNKYPYSKGIFIYKDGSIQC